MSAEDPKNKVDLENSKADADDHGDDNSASADPARKKEVGGRGGLDPTRYGDWEKSGRCIDF